MMRLPLFEFRAPTSVDEATRILDGEGGKAVPLAGGTDLLPNMKRRQQVPKTLVNLRHIELLSWLQLSESGSRLGACLTLAEIAADARFRNGWTALAQAASFVATPQIRNMATLGGNLCLDTRCNYYDQNYEWRKAINFCLKKDGDVCWVAPGSSKCWAVQSSDLVPVMVAIGASFRLVSTLGERVVEAAGFYNDDGIDYLKKRPDELLVDIHLPPTNGWRASYQKLRRRGAFDFPVLGVAAYVREGNASRVSTGSGRDRVVEDARIVLGGIAPSPVQVRDAAQVMIGKSLDEDQIQAAAEAAYVKARPLDNTDFVYQWRKQMARQYTLRALRELL